MRLRKVNTARTRNTLAQNQSLSSGCANLGLSKLLTLFALRGGGARFLGVEEDPPEPEPIAVTCANDSASFSFPGFCGFPLLSGVERPLGPGLSLRLSAIDGRGESAPCTVKERFRSGLGCVSVALFLLLPLPFLLDDESWPAVTVRASL